MEARKCGVRIRGKGKTWDQVHIRKEGPEMTCGSNFVPRRMPQRGGIRRGPGAEAKRGRVGWDGLI